MEKEEANISGFNHIFIIMVAIIDVASRTPIIEFRCVTKPK